jgi:hypothetical protein
MEEGQPTDDVTRWGCDRSRRAGNDAISRTPRSKGRLGKRQRKSWCLAARGARRQWIEAQGSMLKGRIQSRVDGKPPCQGRRGRVVLCLTPSGPETSLTHFCTYPRGPPRHPNHALRTKHCRDGYAQPAAKRVVIQPREDRVETSGAPRDERGPGKACPRPPIRTDPYPYTKVKYLFEDALSVCA